MAVRIERVSALLERRGVRHHFDAEQGVVRLIFVTDTYRNLRKERLVVVTLATPAAGRILRGTIDRAFAVAEEAVQACGFFCRLAADTPLVAVEYDVDSATLRMVVESCIEDGRPTERQVLATIARLVEAAEVWSTAWRQAAAAVAARHEGRDQGAA